MGTNYCSKFISTSSVAIIGTSIVSIIIAAANASAAAVWRGATVIRIAFGSGTGCIRLLGGFWLHFRLCLSEVEGHGWFE
jgi:hypothetical protein